MTRFFVVPQWQGSPAARAMHLIDGAEAIAGDLPRAATVRIDVPVEAGESLDTGIRRFSALTRVRDALTDALQAGVAAHGTDDHSVVIGGDCGVAVPAIAHAATHHETLAVVWFDAHGDLNTPGGSPSGAFSGMALRAVFDDLPLAGSGAVPAERVVLAGVRELDTPEQQLIDEAELTTVDVDVLADPAALVEAVAATGATAVYLHVDLDVLDPAAITGVALPVPFGLSLDELIAAVKAVRAQFPLAGASIAGFAPASPVAAVDDLGTILRIVGALA
ncbi:MAG: arginase [Microbacterium sp. SCN 70-200]|uniref:arginase family protein n=1 Tax=unclassified Microbacterium TaxID=2609290 RepID=UPI00086B482E|nr:MULTISPECIES: arginase family protein [unclassified Microbacterium]MBN9213937.1 arginase family protein [Microbacterium sp.]ODT42474.1 MAG: arginase [Microbacterium sp. SCN 70-200]OJV85397.1 MAG: arginase [Microbacterium sp. 70-16]